MTSAKAVAARRGLVSELVTGQERLAHRIAARAQAEILGYADLTVTEIEPLTLRILKHLLATLAEERAPTSAELQAFREFGAIRGGQGIPLEDILRAWRMSVREILDEMNTVGRSRQVTDRMLLELTHHLLDTVDHAIPELSGGHREVELERARHDQQARADFVQAALGGTLGSAELGVRIQRYGLHLDTGYVPFRARPTDVLSLSDIQQLMTPATARGFTAIIDGDLAGFAERAPESDIPAPVGYGPAARIDQLQQSFARATRALNTAAAYGLTGAHDLGDLGLLPVVLADAEIGDDLVRRYLTPLRTNDSAQALIETLRCYLDTGQRVEQTAERLFVHPNTVRYRISRFEELTGADLRQPGRTLELWWALQREHLNARKR